LTVWVLKVAVHDLLVLMVTCVEVFVPLHAPLQPAKTDPDAADAVKVTTVPRAYAWVQSDPQLIPEGFEVTVPLPEPFFETESCVSRGPEKVAVTPLAPSIVTEHGLIVPEQAPPHPEKTELPVGVAVSVTTVPCA